MVLVGITHTDTEVDIEYLAPKLLSLRLWGDENNRWSKSVKESDF